jgi:hypothetical protein
MEYYHDQHIGVYKNAFSDEWCDKIIDYFNQNIEKSISRTEREGSKLGIRDTQYILQDHNLINEFNDIFYKILDLYTYKYIQIPIPLNITGYKIQKTLPTEGFHPFHIEQGNNLYDFRRIGVWALYLNNVEEGGETEFLYQLKRIKPQKGTLCIFPAGYTHVHRGNTPFSGDKYIMTGWLDIVLPDNIKIVEN